MFSKICKYNVKVDNYQTHLLASQDLLNSFHNKMCKLNDIIPYIGNFSHRGILAKMTLEGVLNFH